MTTTNRIQTYQEFWPFYLKEHSKKATRNWHYVGSTIGFICLVLFFVTFQARFILLGLVAGYACAWFSHFTIEKNRPATFKYPLWSLASDWKMWFLWLTGGLKKELQKYQIEQ